MKSSFCILIFCLTVHSTFGQYSKYIVQLKDKNGSSFNINDPSQFLSQRAIARRQKQNIPIDIIDLPVVSRYLDSIQSAGTVTILNLSKWLNQVCILTTDALALKKINSFSFVINTQPLKRVLRSNEPIDKKDPIINSIGGSPKKELGNYYDYGNSFNQIHIHEGEYIHNQGFHGEGMVIGIIDAGFYHYLSNRAFDSVRNHNRIIETYDFVNNKTSVNEEDAHGMNCFSIIASNIPGTLVGSCPSASFLLYKSEDVNSEYPVEEQNWVAAAERADSAGVDVLSTSLGYTTFDNSIFDHTYQQMNGKSTIIARANAIAARKGIISIVAAGNEGNTTWHYISTPADADSILAVGAVSVNGIPGTFSSYGFSSDGRVKPDVASIGVGAAIVGVGGTGIYGNGTSYSAPNITGLTTGLWQAFPEFSNIEVLDAIKKSSSIYNMPDNRIGYGIPNFHIAFTILHNLRAQRNIIVNENLKVYPSPFSNNLKIAIKPTSSGKATISIYDELGKLCFFKQYDVIAGEILNIYLQPLPVLDRGIYTLKYYDGINTQSKKIMKL
ncbi:MAG: S8 family serine peptidase [Ginsengibacter sp.]